MNRVDIGSLITPFRQSSQLFLQLIASTFAIYKLLPMDYPGLRDLSVPLSLKQIVRTAWGNVRFTRDRATQAILFFAVMGIMIFGSLVVLSAIFSFFIGTAQAASCSYSSTGTFAPECNDVAQAWLDFLFNGGQLPSSPEMIDSTTKSFGSASQADSAFGIQVALQGILGFYSNAILIVAALVLFYHLASMVLETAHTGVPMGKQARQIWAPLRLVMAIGLLVPISGGLNSGQYIVIKVAELGSGLASQTWSLFLSAMTDPANYSVGSYPMMTDFAKTMIRNYACMEAMNARVIAAAKSAGAASVRMPIPYDSAHMPATYGTSTFQNPSSATINGEFGDAGKGQGKYSFATQDLDGFDVCGYVFLPSAKNESDGYSEQIYAAHRSALFTSAGALHDAGKAILTLIPNADGGTADDKASVDINSVIPRAIAKYQIEVNNQLKSAVSSLKPTGLTSIRDAMQQYGWAYAGAFISTIERMQGMIGSAVQAGTPKAGEPKVKDSNLLRNTAIGAGVGAGVGLAPVGAAAAAIYTLAAESTRQKVAADMDKFSASMDLALASGVTTTPTTGDVISAQCAATAGVDELAAQVAKGTGGKDSGIEYVIDGILWVVDIVATQNGVWQSGTGETCKTNGAKTFKLGVTFSSGVDALQELATFGHANVNTGLRMMGYAVSATLVGGIAALLGAGAVGAGVGALVAGIFSFFAMMFLALGFIFAFILPLIPFTRFFFAVIVWIGEVIESVVAIPVVALGHLNPEGEGFLSQQAKTAYFFVFSIFLRPIMTVFGLIVGLLIFIVAANFLTYAYGVAVASYGGTAYAHELLSKFIYTALYCYMMFVCANKSFEMITHLPEGAVKWMGAPKSQTPQLGDIKEMQQHETLVAGLAIDKGIDGVNKTAQGVSGAAGEIRKGRDADTATQTAADRHTELIDTINRHP
ncbi:MAG: DotA/TraY family protein [Bdellovibrionales bacterium]